MRVLPWTADRDATQLRLTYEVGARRYTEVVDLPVALPLERDDVRGVVDLLAVVAGVSYFKTTAPSELLVDGLDLTSEQRGLVEAIYERGLREFAYRNGLPIPVPLELRAAATAGRDAPDVSAGLRPLIPLGGGRDSSLTTDVLHHLDPALLSIGANPYTERIAAHFGTTLLVAGRRLDPQLTTDNANGALNGHVPVTAINSLISVLVAAATDRTAVVMANERSASSPSLVTADGYDVNHQYSKSFECERLLAAAVASTGTPVAYFSAVRPWGELAIARAFARLTELLPLFMSCNRAFVRSESARSDGWCGECAKCCFVFLTLAPFLTPEELMPVFARNLLDDDGLLDQFGPLLSTCRPFDCVGEVTEAEDALWLLQSLPGWSGTRVVTELAPRLPSRQQPTSLAMATEHAVPDEYLRLFTRAMG